MNPLKLKEVITEEIFFDAFEIMRQQANHQIFNDLNFFMLTEEIRKTKNNKLKSFYVDYIECGVALAVPRYVCSDLIHVPKKVSSLREYRFLSMYGFAMYYSVGLYIAELVYENLKQIRANRKNISVFSPVKASKVERRNKLHWSIKDDYRLQYKKFNDLILRNCVKGVAVLRVDIQNFYDDLSHSILIEHIDELALNSKKIKNNFDHETKHLLMLYFSLLSEGQKGIPQGKKNLISSYLGDFYLSMLDLKIEDLVQSSGLSLKSFVRYVDDIFIIVESGDSIKNIHKKIIGLESRLTKWLLINLNLKLNPNKTKTVVFQKDTDVDKFKKTELKEVSFAKDNVTSQTKFNKIVSTLNKFKYENHSQFDLDFNNSDRELIKYIFTDSFMGCLKDTENMMKLGEAFKKVDFDLISPVLSILSKIMLAPVNKTDKISKASAERLLEADDISEKKILEILAYWYMSNQNNLKGCAKTVNLIGRKIEEKKESLLEDNLGRYIIALYRKEDIKGIEINTSAVCKSITGTWIGLKKKIDEDWYEKFLKKYISSTFVNPQTTMQIVLLVRSIIHGNYDNCINHAFSTLESLSKQKYNVKDNGTINDITSKIANLHLNDEIVLRKLADRRNLNSISHSGKHSKPSLIATKTECYSYLSSTFSLINKYFL